MQESGVTRKTVKQLISNKVWTLDMQEGHQGGYLGRLGMIWYRNTRDLPPAPPIPQYEYLVLFLSFSPFLFFSFLFLLASLFSNFFPSHSDRIPSRLEASCNVMKVGGGRIWRRIEGSVAWLTGSGKVDYGYLLFPLTKQGDQDKIHQIQHHHSSLM